MNYEAADLLDMVDEWKFKLHDKLTRMTPEEETEFWRLAGEKARARGLRVVEKLSGRKTAKISNRKSRSASSPSVRAR